jgi:hypothetical protein
MGVKSIVLLEFGAEEVMFITEDSWQRDRFEFGTWCCPPKVEALRSCLI